MTYKEMAAPRKLTARTLIQTKINPFTEITHCTFQSFFVFLCIESNQINMKSFTILFLAAVFAVVSIKLSAQSFVSTANQWNVKLTFFQDYSTEIFTLGGDTLIEEVHYKILLSSSDSLQTHYFAGALREQDNKVYYRPPGATEGLLYDFTLMPGDTAHIRNSFCGDLDIPVVVLELDTVEYFGSARKRWTVAATDMRFTEYWIEGVGSISGPVYSMFNYCIVCPHWELLCYYENEMLQYMMPFSEICYVNTVSIAEQFEEKFAVQPNHFNRGEDVVVQLPPHAKELQLFDTHGRLINSIRAEGRRTLRIETGGLLPGLHLLTLTTRHNTILTRKLICR